MQFPLLITDVDFPMQSNLLVLTQLSVSVCSHGLKEDHGRFFYQQIILALDYCHKMNISNRDIKLENTLLDSTEPGRNPLIKLCDFGYSINESHSLPKTAVGTPGYTGESLNVTKVSSKSMFTSCRAHR